MTPSSRVPSTVSVAFVRQLIGTGLERGLPLEDLLALAGGLTREALDAPRGRVTSQQFSRLYASMVHRFRNENLSLSPRVIERGSFETVVRAASTASSFRECLEIVARALSVAGVAARTARLTPGGAHGVVFPPPSSDDPGASQLDELLVFTASGTLAWLFGRRLIPRRVDFASHAPTYRRELEYAYGTALEFGCSNSALWFDTALAEVVPTRSARELPGFVHGAPATVMEALLRAGEQTALVRAELRRALPALLSLDTTARRLGLSARSLHRRLEGEGTSFQQLKDDVRRDLAVHALLRTHTPLKQIAAEVGFSDQPSFTRAFVQWTGRTPSMWRKLAARGDVRQGADDAPDDPQAL